MSVSITEPVIGLRRFSVKKDGTLHSPIIDGHDWHIGVNEAKCIKTRFWQPWKHDGPSPVENCSCGIYAHHEEVKGKGRGDDIIGVVRGWGQVRVHPDGWRAQKAELLGIFGNFRDKELLAKVAQRYEVPILPANAKPEFLAMEFGPFVPKEIRPSPQSTPTQHYMVADYVLWATAGSMLVGSVGLAIARRLQAQQIHS